MYILKWPKLDFNGFVNDIIIGLFSHIFLFTNWSFETSIYSKQILIQLLLKIIDNGEKVEEFSSSESIKIIQQKHRFFYITLN